MAAGSPSSASPPGVAVNQPAPAPVPVPAHQARSAQLLELVDLLPDLAAIFDLDGAIRHLNVVARRALGLGSGPWPSAFSLIHPEDLARVHETIATLVAGGTAAAQLLRVRVADSWAWYELSGTVLVEATGEPGGLLVVGTDQTDRIRAERNLQDSEEAYRRLFELSPVPMSVHQDGAFVFVNAAAARLLGAASAAEIQGRRVSEFLVAADPARLPVPAAADPASGESPFYEARIVRLDGSELEVEVATAPITFAGAPATQTVARDLSGRKAAEAERLVLERRLLESQKLESLGVMAGGVAHDFNNLLVAIMGNAGLAMLELPAASPARENLAAIEDAAQRAADLAHQMLAYAGKARFSVSAVNLSDLVREMSRLLTVSISRKVTLECHLAEALPTVDGDATQLGQILMNLVINAAEAIDEDTGTVRLSTGIMQASRAYLAEAHCSPAMAPGRYCYVEVQDTGPGMDEATRSRIFDPFFTTKFTGRGLGLAAALGIVRAHHGAIRIDSAPGKGACFRLLLPFHPAARDPVPGAQPAAPAWRGSGAILVVDDEEVVRAVTRRALQRFGFTTHLAADGEEGLDLFRRHAGEVVAVLLDLTMPRLGGRELRQALRKISPALPILIMSGYEEQDAIEGLALDSRGAFLHKPFTVKQLETSVRSLLEPA
jgi:PAS domain S-box-containing protein